jgi:cell division septal protein FtsQ
MRRRQHKPRYTPSRGTAVLRARRSGRSRARSTLPRRAAARHLILGLVVLLVLTSAGYGAYWLVKRLHRAPEYVVHTITVEGASLLTTQEVLEIAGLDPGQPILDYPIGKARERLVADPMIRSASITRELPNTIIVRVVERTPIARLDDAWLVDGDGYLLTENGVQDKLPVITGVSPKNPKEGTRVDDERLDMALEIIKLYVNSSLPELMQIKSVYVRTPGKARLYAVEGPNTCANARFDLGGEDFGIRLAKLDEVLRTEPRRVKEADLTHRARVYVKTE